MSKLHPIIAVTGSSGADLSTVRHAFKDVFRRLGIRPALLKRIPKSRMANPRPCWCRVASSSSP